MTTEPKANASRIPMPMPLARLIYENFSFIMMFACSRRELARVIETAFTTEWKYLYPALVEVPIQRVTRACLELGMLLRVLDEEQGLSDILQTTVKDPLGRTLALGRVIKEGARAEPLYFRDMTNKLVHASSYEWDLS